MTYRENYFQQKRLRELHFQAQKSPSISDSIASYIRERVNELRRVKRGLRLLNALLSHQEASA